MRRMIINVLVAAVVLGLLLGTLHVLLFVSLRFGVPMDFAMAAGNGAMHAIGGIAVASVVLAVTRRQNPPRITFLRSAVGNSIVAVPAVLFFSLYGTWWFAVSWVAVCVAAGTVAFWLAGKASSAPA